MYTLVFKRSKRRGLSFDVACVMSLRVSTFLLVPEANISSHYLHFVRSTVLLVHRTSYGCPLVFALTLDFETALRREIKK